MRKLCILLVSIAAMAAFSARSDASIQRKQYQSVGFGCPGGTVNTIYRKGNDNLWIGADNQVAKLTGTGFKVYSPGAGDIRQIIQDSCGNVWVLADSALCRFRGPSGDFEKFEIAPTAAFALEDRCLFASGTSIFSYSGSSLSDVASFAAQGKYIIDHMFKWTGDSLLLVDSVVGSLLYDCATGEVTKCSFVPAGVSAVFVDSRMRLWYGKPGEGLRCLDSTGKVLAEYTGSESDLPGNTVKCIGESNGRIVVLTESGLCRIQPDQGGEIITEKQVAGDPASFPTTDVASMFCDSDGSIWFGRSRGGVFVDHQVQIDAVQTKAFYVESISAIYSLPSRDKVWVGTYGAGVMTYDPSAENLPNSISVIPQTSGLSVASIANYSDSELILSCIGRGFMLLDKNTGNVRHLETGNIILDAFGRDGSSVVYEVCDGPQGSVMMMSGTDMYRYSPVTRTFSEVRLPESASGKGPLSAAFPGEPGLYYWNSKSLFEYDVMSSALVDVIRFSDLTILSASSSEDGNVWLGTDKGLVCLNRATRKYELMPLPCGCAVESVLCGPAGRIWLGTVEGLRFYDSATRRFTAITPSDGIFNTCYTDRAKYLDAEVGEIYMGGIDGFARVDGSITFPATISPEIVLESISDGDKVVSDLSRFKPERSDHLTLEVYAKDSDILRDRFYLFTIDGAGAYHQEIETRTPVLTLANLPKGRVRVSAACSLKTGDWSESYEVASFKVGAPWCRTVSFYALLILLLAAAAVYMLYRRFKLHKHDTSRSYMSRSNEERLNFLVNISHELRTPLTLTMGPLEKTLASLTDDDPNYKRLNGALKQTKKMKTLLDTVLTAAKVQADGTGGALNLSYQSFNNWLKHVATDFKEEADAHRITLKTEYDSKIGMLDFDEEKCQVVLSNLLMNALAHNPDDSEIQIWSEYHPERATVRVSVSDSGPGIKEEELSEIFNRFYQDTEENHGFGIGLAYSKQIMDNMNGVLGAYNNSRGGATFYFELPTSAPDQNAATSPEPKPAVKPVVEPVSKPAPWPVEPAAKPASEPVTSKAASVPAAVITGPVKSRTVVDPNSLPFEEPRNIPDPVIDLKNASILVVEDDVALREYLRDELSESLRKVYVAGNGVEAIEVLNSEDINVVVSDVMMPEMDGFTLCRYIKTTVSVSHIPVILLTARSDENSRLLGYKNGADDYITKPFDLEVLKDSIQRLFFSREAMRQRFVSPLDPMPSAEETTFSSADEKFLEKFSKLVSDNISDPDLDSKFLVDNMGMSRTVLFNKVKQLTGLNLQNYVNKVRMEYVIKLMSTTSMSLGEIAEKAGFSSPRYFSTSFKNYTGVTPTQYKKDHR